MFIAQIFLGLPYASVYIPLHIFVMQFLHSFIRIVNDLLNEKHVIMVVISFLTTSSIFKNLKNICLAWFFGMACIFLDNNE